MRKKKISNKKESLDLHTFMITIQDEFHSCTYFFRLPENISYADIASAIAKKFKIETPEGNFSEGEGIEH